MLLNIVTGGSSNKTKKRKKEHSDDAYFISSATDRGSSSSTASKRRAGGGSTKRQRGLVKNKTKSTREKDNEGIRGPAKKKTAPITRHRVKKRDDDEGQSYNAEEEDIDDNDDDEIDRDDQKEDEEKDHETAGKGSADYINEKRIVKSHRQKKFSREMFSAKVASFEALNVPSRLVDSLQASMSIRRPTLIQIQAIPVLMEGKDVMFKSKTGSGKTLAFLLPMVSHLVNDEKRKRRLKRTDGTHAIVIAPTRELVLQINHVLQNLLKSYYWIVSTTLMGGEKKKSEKARLRKGAIVVLATPGRLLDHLITTKAFKVNQVEIMVLDEADRLLDLGFEKDLKSILQILNERKGAHVSRQSVLTSATLSTKLEQLAQISLKNPELLGFDQTEEEQEGEENDDEEGKDEQQQKGPSRLRQHYVCVDSKYRLTVLAALLKSLISSSSSTASSSKPRKIMVFFGTCDSVEFHVKLLSGTCWPPSDTSTKLLDNITFHMLHGNLPQKERTKTYFKFCNAEEGILFATDVAARGLDLPLVDYIVQYDPPDHPDTYVHRVGRTARMGQKGQAILFLQRSEMDYASLLKAKGLLLSEASVVSILAHLNYDDDEDDELMTDGTKSKLPPGLELQNSFETLVSSDAELHELARLSFLSSVRAYGSYPRSMKHIFHPKKLHLGYVAKSFGLKEPPKRLANSKKKKEGSWKRTEKKSTKASKQATIENAVKNPINRKKQPRRYGDDLRKNKNAKGKMGQRKKSMKWMQIDQNSEFAS